MMLWRNFLITRNHLLYVIAPKAFRVHTARPNRPQSSPKKPPPAPLWFTAFISISPGQSDRPADTSTCTSSGRPWPAPVQVSASLLMTMDRARTADWMINRRFGPLAIWGRISAIILLLINTLWYGEKPRGSSVLSLRRWRYWDEFITMVIAWRILKPKGKDGMKIFQPILRNEIIIFLIISW